MGKKVSIILCDGTARRRAAVSHFLASAGIHVEPFEDPAEVGDFWSHGDLVLVHDDGKGVSEVMDQLDQANVFLPVIAYSEQPGTHRVVRAVQAGALDYLSWPCNEAEVRESIAYVQKNAESRSILKQRQMMARRQVERLTKREQEVLSAIASGLSNRKVGEKLEISPRTVEIHRANLLLKMGANHTSEAIRIAVEAGLVT